MVDGSTIYHCNNGEDSVEALPLFVASIGHSSTYSRGQLLHIFVLQYQIMCIRQKPHSLLQRLTLQQAISWLAPIIKRKMDGGGWVLCFLFEWKRREGLLILAQSFFSFLFLHFLLAHGGCVRE